MKASTLIKAKYSGTPDQTGQYVNIGIQTVSILIGGLVLWRASNYFFNKKQKDRAKKSAFETRYSQKWKNR